MKCLSCDGKRRPTIKEVSMELEALRKSKKCLEIFQEPHLLRDEASLMHNAKEDQESMEETIISSLEMECTSILTSA
jgi:hypothetical protein